MIIALVKVQKKRKLKQGFQLICVFLMMCPDITPLILKGLSLKEKALELTF